MKKILIFLFLFFSIASAQQTLVRRAELGDSTAVLRELISTYDIDSSTVKTLIGDTATVLRNEMSDINSNVTILLYGNVSTPEEYGAIGNGITNDAVAVKKSIDSAGTRKIVFQQTYAISDSIVINTANANYDIEFTPQAKIISSVAPKEYGTYAEHGHITIRDANKVYIKGINLEVTNSGYKTTSDNALMLDNPKEVILEGGTIRGGGFANIRVHGADNLSIKNMLLDSAMYAGIMITNTTHSYIVGNTINEIGDKDSVPYNGYGITFSHQFGTGIDNENAYISGNKINRTYRKNIDVHGCKNAVIDGNFAKGFGYAGIYAVNEGDNLPLNEKYVADVIISNNIVEQDTSWYNSLTPYTSGVKFYHPIQAGSFGNVPYSGGVIDINNNIIKNVTSDSLRACISLFAGTGVAQPLMKIKSNSIEADIKYTGQGLVYLNGTVSDPLNIEFEGNVLKGSADNAVNLESGRTIKTSANIFDGTFTNAYNINGAADTTDNGSLVVSIGDIFRGTFSKIVKGTTASTGDAYLFYNMIIKGTVDTIFDFPTWITRFASGTYNDRQLPNLISRSDGTNGFQIETSTNPDTLALHRLSTIYDVISSQGGTAKVDYEVEVTAHDLSFVGTFYVTAYAADSLGSPKFYYQITKSEIVRGTESTYEPQFYFGSGTTAKTFYIICPTSDTKYHILAKQTAWRLRPEISLEN